jgi:3-phenylpropionate/trans-cinnamate dioxygenase ferredoxin subunit
VGAVAQSEHRRVAAASEIPQGRSLCVEVEGREVLICHLAEGFFAVDNICTHARARMSEGRLRGHRVLCPLHGAAFDVRDGSVLGRPAVRPLGSHSLELRGDDLFLALRDE